jgi:hypothetical protein
MPVTVENDLSIRVGRNVARLTPSEGYAIAEKLIRTATRRLIAEEMGFAEPSPAFGAGALR